MAGCMILSVVVGYNELVEEAPTQLLRYAVLVDEAETALNWGADRSLGAGLLRGTGKQRRKKQSAGVTDQDHAG